MFSLSVDVSKNCKTCFEAFKVDNIRDCDRSTWVKVRDRPSELLGLLVFVDDLMLEDAISVRLDAIFRHIRDSSNQRMRCRAVIAFVVVLDQPFPVCINIHIPFVVIFKFLSEVKLVHSFTFVHTVELIFPCNTGFLLMTRGLQIDPNKTSLINVNMDR